MSNQSTELFHSLLSLDTNWRVLSVTTDDVKNAVIVEIHYISSTASCTSCGEKMNCSNSYETYSFETRKSLHRRTLIHLRVPNCDCDTCGRSPILAPWQKLNRIAPIKISEKLPLQQRTVNGTPVTLQGCLPFIRVQVREDGMREQEKHEWYTVDMLVDTGSTLPLLPASDDFPSNWHWKKDWEQIRDGKDAKNVKKLLRDLAKNPEKVMDKTEKELLKYVCNFRGAITGFHTTLAKVCFAFDIAPELEFPAVVGFLPSNPFQDERFFNYVRRESVDSKDSETVRTPKGLLSLQFLLQYFDVIFEDSGSKFSASLQHRNGGVKKSVR